jgi:methyl-accepting chemotaxis protein WspA
MVPVDGAIPASPDADRARALVRYPPRMLGFLLSIRTRLVLWFLLLALAPIGALFFSTSAQTEREVESAALRSLAAVAEEKSARLDAYARERLRSVASVSTGLAFVGAAQELSAAYGPSGTRDAALYDAALAKYAPRIESFATICEFPTFMVIDATGRVVYSLRQSPLLHRSLAEPGLAELGLARVLPRVREQRKALVTPGQVALDETRPSLEVVGPLLKGEEVVGFIAVSLAPEEIDRIIADYSALGRTGDILCCARIGGEVVVTTPTRDDADAAFRLRVKLGSETARRLQELVMGNSFRGRGTDTDGHAVLGAWTRVPSLGWGIAVTQHVEEVLAVAHAQERAAVRVALIVLLPVLLLGWFVARGISLPIAEAAASSERLAGGDLSKSVRVRGVGESRALLSSMQRATDGLVTLLGRIRTSGLALGEAAERIRRSAREQAEIAQQFGASSTEIAAAVREITSTQQELSDTMQSVAASVREASAAAGKGRTALDGLSSEMRGIEEGVGGVARNLDEIRDRAERIGLVVASMAKVANQTNLLSVNAAMEAERAGEAGAGFRAVAREIRRLSEQTADAALAIEAIVAEMQASVARGVTEMERYRASVSGGVATSQTVGRELGTVIGGVERVGGEVDLVARGMEAQALGVAQVGQAIASLSEGAARTAAVAAGASDTGEALESRASGFLREVDAFRLPEQRPQS